MRMVAGISGASGMILGIRLLKFLKDKQIETHLILSRMAQKIIDEETPTRLPRLRNWPPSPMNKKT